MQDYRCCTDRYVGGTTGGKAIFTPMGLVRNGPGLRQRSLSETAAWRKRRMRRAVSIFSRQVS